MSEVLWTYQKFTGLAISHGIWYDVLFLQDIVNCCLLRFVSEKSIDFVGAQSLINVFLGEISVLRNEDEFSKLFDWMNRFSSDCDIDLNAQMRQRRARMVPNQLKDYSVDSTITERDSIDNESTYKISLFHPVIDSILLEINNRFSRTDTDILRGMSSLSPDSQQILEVEELKPLCTILKCDVSLLNNEVQVLRPMWEGKFLKSMTDLYFEMLPYKQAFLACLSILVAAMTIPVSSPPQKERSAKWSW